MPQGWELEDKPGPKISRLLVEDIDTNTGDVKQIALYFNRTDMLQLKMAVDRVFEGDLGEPLERELLRTVVTEIERRYAVGPVPYEYPEFDAESWLAVTKEVLGMSGRAKNEEVGFVD